MGFSKKIKKYFKKAVAVSLAPVTGGASLSYGKDPVVEPDKMKYVYGATALVTAGAGLALGGASAAAGSLAAKSTGGWVANLGTAAGKLAGGGFVGNVISAGVQGSIYGAGIGGIQSAITGGNIKEGILSGAKYGAVGGAGGFIGGSAGGSLAGGVAGKSFTTAKTIGGFLGAGLATKAVGATNQQALMSGVAGGLDQFGSANLMKDGMKGSGFDPNYNAAANYKAGLKAAGTMGSMALMAVPLVSGMFGAKPAGVSTGFSPINLNRGTGEQTVTPNFKAPEIPSGGKAITDQNFGGAGMPKDFNANAITAYQDRETVSANKLSRARKSFDYAQMLQSRRMKVV
jgi:hypothetical protein